jgi:hypothetical protein
VRSGLSGRLLPTFHLFCRARPARFEAKDHNGKTMNNAPSLDLAPLQSFATPKLGAVASQDVAAQPLQRLSRYLGGSLTSSGLGFRFSSGNSSGSGSSMGLGIQVGAGIGGCSSGFGGLGVDIIAPSRLF